MSRRFIISRAGLELNIFSRAITLSRAGSGRGGFFQSRRSSIAKFRSRRSGIANIRSRRSNLSRAGVATSTRATLIRARWLKMSQH